MLGAEWDSLNVRLVRVEYAGAAVHARLLERSPSTTNTIGHVVRVVADINLRTRHNESMSSIQLMRMVIQRASLPGMVVHLELPITRTVVREDGTLGLRRGTLERLGGIKLFEDLRLIVLNTGDV